MKNGCMQTLQGKNKNKIKIEAYNSVKFASPANVSGISPVKLFEVRCL